jgi:exosome complex exonuclease RRP6
MHILNSSFTNPRIVKVFHGADSDILWLQKDLGLYVERICIPSQYRALCSRACRRVRILPIRGTTSFSPATSNLICRYIVNLFDTGQAARVLEFPRFSLAYLLKEYCGITANKAFQLSDWRIRPLTSDMAR